MIPPRCYHRVEEPSKEKKGLSVDTTIRPCETEVASSLRKWRHSPRIDHDVLGGKSLRWEMRKVQTAQSGVCKMHRVIGRVY